MIFTWEKRDIGETTLDSHFTLRNQDGESLGQCGQEVLSSSSGSDTNQLNDLGQVI